MSEVAVTADRLDRAGRAAARGCPSTLEGVLAADGPVRHERRDRRDRSHAARRGHRPAVARARVLHRDRGVRLLLPRGRVGRLRRRDQRRRKASAWPPLLAAIGAVVLAGIAGALFSPIAGRLQGHLPRPGLDRPGVHRPAHPAERDGRSPAASTAATPRRSTSSGFRLRRRSPDELRCLRRPLRPARAALVPRDCCSCSSLPGTRATCCAHRPGRALEAIRDSEVAAAVMGVNVPRVPRGGVHRELDVRGPGRRLPRARLRPDRARELRLPVLDRLPRDDRPRRAGLRSAARSSAP